mgnify:CR=1 FL=1
MSVRHLCDIGPISCCLDIVYGFHRNCCNRLIAGLGQLHVFATCGFSQVFAHAAADELPLGVDHQQLDPEYSVAGGDVQHLSLIHI